jgi:spore maturation protein CgeB
MLPYLFAGSQKLGINPYAHYWTIAGLQHAFRRSLTTARYGYTCGSVARMAIRKYFEIPAAGCVLIADRCEGFEALGFRDRENAVAAAGDDVVEVHRWLSSLPDQGQAIAEAGRRHIREQHTVEARSRQLSAALDAILEERYAGSRWIGGRFHLRTTDGKERPL